MENNDVNLSLVCPWNLMVCPIMEDLKPEERKLCICAINCDVDIEEVFNP